MTLIADTLLIAGALAAAFYCIVLARRLNRFTDLEKGVGGAIAVLSGQVDDMTRALATAQETAAGSTDTLDDLTKRAEEVARRLELLVASMHDLPDTAPPAAPQAEPPSVNPAENAPGEPESEEAALFLSQRARVREVRA